MVTNKVLRIGDAYRHIQFDSTYQRGVSFTIRSDEGESTTFEGEGDDGEDVEGYELATYINLHEVKSLIKFLQDFVDQAE